MKKKFTIRDILDFNPCSSYTEEKITELFKSVGCKKYVTVDKLFKANIPHYDFFWLILRPEFIPEKELHQIAIWCFERIAQPIWEKYYPENKRPQEAIRVKKLWLEGKATTEDLAVVRDAAWAAEAAARDAAGAAAWAAEAAARDAAGAAAGTAARDTAWAAGAAAGTAARDAAWAAGAAAWAAWAAGAAGDAAAEEIKNHTRKVCEKLNKKEEK